MATSAWSAIVDSTELAVATITPQFFDLVIDLSPFEGASVFVTADFPATPVSNLRAFAVPSLGEVDFDGTSGGAQSGQTIELKTGPDSLDRDAGSWVDDGWKVNHQFLMLGSAIPVANRGWYTVDPANPPTALVLRVIKSGDGPSVPLSAGGPHADVVLAGGLFAEEALVSRSIDSAVDFSAAPMFLRHHKRWRVAAARVGPTDSIDCVAHYRTDGVRF